MRMKIVFPDGSGFIGNRHWYFTETKGTHHFIVEQSDFRDFQQLIGQRVAIPIASVKYFVLPVKVLPNEVTHDQGSRT